MTHSKNKQVTMSLPELDVKIVDALKKEMKVNSRATVVSIVLRAYVIRSELSSNTLLELLESER